MSERPLFDTTDLPYWMVEAIHLHADIQLDGKNMPYRYVMPKVP
jgi:hypothetical protein